ENLYNPRMQHSVYSLRNFYVSKSGRLIRRLLLRHILRLWPDVAGFRVMGYGYVTPYMKALRDRTERVFAFMPASLGAHPWPDDGPNLVAVAEEGEIPLETESVDRIILVHALESAEHYDRLLKELWRILKS